MAIFNSYVSLPEGICPMCSEMTSYAPRMAWMATPVVFDEWRRLGDRWPSPTLWSFQVAVLESPGCLGYTD